MAEQYIEPLDVLADRANFGDVDDGVPTISVRGKKLTNYLNGRERMFYHWRKIRPNETWADVEIVTFDDPRDYSGARMYMVPREKLDNVVREQSQIDLSKETPTHSGKEVAEVLRQYASQ